MDEHVKVHADALAHPLDATHRVGAYRPQSMGIVLVSAAAVTTIGLLLASWALEAQIARPLEQALRVASRDAHSALHLDRVDEIGMTVRTIGQLGLMFRWIIDDVSAQVRNVQNAISEIAQGNSDLSARTEQAASSVQGNGLFDGANDSDNAKQRRYRDAGNSTVGFGKRRSSPRGKSSPGGCNYDERDQS